MKRLYKYTVPDHYSDAIGIFWAEPEEIKAMCKKKDVYLGAVAGKHSEVIVGINEKDFEDITDKIIQPNFSAGLNLFDYVPSFDILRLNSGEEFETYELEEPTSLKKIGDSCYVDEVENYVEIYDIVEEDDEIVFLAKKVEE
jgi:hypothetical protein